MNCNTLRYIVTVAETGNFTIASKKLFITQPSLSQIIKNEEKRLGVSLFDRSQNPIILTNAGAEYVHWARQILYLHENMERRLVDFSSNENLVVRIGILPECSAFILPNPLRLFRENNPNIFVQIREFSSNELKRNLEESQLDFIVGLTHSDTYKYFNIPLYNEKIVLAVPDDYILPEKSDTEINLFDFAEAPFVMMEEGQFLYNVTHDLCKGAGFVPKSAVECYNLETALRMIKAGVGVSLIPDLMARIVKDLNYYNIKGFTPQSQISIVFRRDRYLSKGARKLIKLIKNQSSEG